jgi:hypothetical protein
MGDASESLNLHKIPSKLDEELKENSGIHEKQF